ncbi:hypothetical protein P691DRAFT_705908 [Macrolepiota fuliginosa MF-IS2]|uniref:PWWP domain-containing protein n=1 Tax=Macrolepiota fuliginosa MF-IS2 TaxID=1400762 RepID=A0A9P5XEN2_9AGAR|nr:hypothetical protein P691DRAFT_705908 [Macrolepiota fuliginosa MF-IS2]
MSKKGGKAAKETASYDTRDIVLGKVRGYPPWPGMVVDPGSVPPVVLKERPTTKKTQFYCVRFFPTGDFAWLVSKDISKLQPHEIQSYINEPNKKSGDLLQGYRIALDPTKWEEEREAESRLAAEEEANAEVDQLDSEDEDGASAGDNFDDSDSAKTKKSRKRKRESDASASVSSKAKKAPKRKDNGRKSNAMVESEEEDADNVAADDGDGGPSKKGSPPPAKRVRRDKEDDGDDAKISTDPEAMKVRDWRHKLQKTFLSHKGHPREEDMPSIDALFTTVENYDRITIEYLQFSKIGKVMRHIAVLSDDKVPRNAEFKFKDRADALVKKWQQILNANKPANGAGADSLILSAAPISAVPASASLGGQDMKEEAATAVMQGTAAISLNGKPVDGMWFVLSNSELVR